MMSTSATVSAQRRTLPPMLARTTPGRASHVLQQLLGARAARRPAACGLPRARGRARCRRESSLRSSAPKPLSAAHLRVLAGLPPASPGRADASAASRAASRPSSGPGPAPSAAREAGRELGLELLVVAKLSGGHELGDLLAPSASPMPGKLGQRCPWRPARPGPRSARRCGRRRCRRRGDLKAFSPLSWR